MGQAPRNASGGTSRLPYESEDKILDLEATEGGFKLRRLIVATPWSVLLALGASACSDNTLAPKELVVVDSVSVGLAGPDLLADPFVALLIGSLTDQTAADAIRVALGRLAAAGPTQGTLTDQLASYNAPRSDTGVDNEDIVALTALRFLLDRAAQPIQAAPPSEPSRKRR